jgi:Domain of unknown function (DUF4124)
MRLFPVLTVACAAAVLALLTSVWHTANAQEIYRSVDAQGHVVYSDRGATRNAPKTSLHVEEGDAAEAARLARQQQLLQAQNAQRSKQDAAADKARESAERSHDQACKNARNDYYRLMDARRVAEPQRDADGNRVYYSDDEADALREKAKKAMDGACAN